MINIKSYAGNVAAIHDENPPDGGSLHLTGSLFLGSVQKIAVIEVAYDMESTSYSGAEYSWDPTENMYGEDKFVLQ